MKIADGKSYLGSVEFSLVLIHSPLQGELSVQLSTTKLLI